MSSYLPQKTIKYKTYIKRASIEALRAVFQHHIDPMLAKTTVNLDYPRTEADFPAVIIRFFERDITNAGIGHVEWIELFDADGVSGGVYRFKHYFYTGDLEFAILGLSSLDRDLVSDSLVGTIAMGRLESYTNRFFSRIYSDGSEDPDAVNHFININTDVLQGFGESQQPTPWASEDDLIYQSSYRIKVFGEFYSLPPGLPAGLIEHIRLYPYVGGVEPVPTGDPNDDSEWLP